MNATTDGPLTVLSTTSDRSKSAGMTRGSRGSRILRSLLRAACATVASVAVLAALGAVYETVAGSTDASIYPPAGRLVDVGGYRMHLDCRGKGSPTVVMDAGLGGSSLDWTLVQADAASTTRVCSYDRAGMGWSDASPLPRTPGHIADELHTLLNNAGVHGPYVLVGHSLAGKNIRMFASTYPDEVAGMVLVDARSEYVDALTPKAEADAFRAALEMQGILYGLARHLGVARALGASLVGAPLVPPAVATEMALLQTRSAAIDETTKEGLARSADDPALTGFSLGSIPLVVIAAGASTAGIPNWANAQNELVALSTQGKLVVAEQSGHAVQLEDPGVVLDAIDDVVSMVRADH
jgi:pimeloyl-ACP methyl ester carboxylesterase